MTKESIREFYEKKLKEYLDSEFEEYCTCDDYYEPVVEDYFSIPFSVPSAEARASPILEAS